MTDNSNNSGWFTPAGEETNSNSVLIKSDLPREPQIVVGKGGLEINGTGPVRHDMPVSYASGQEAPVDDSIMATVKSAHGGPIVGRVPNGQDRVSINGMETRIEAAIASGFLTRNQDGTFSDKAAPETLRNPVAEAEAMKPAESHEGDQSNDSDFSLSSEASEALTTIVNGAMQGDAIKAMDSIILQGDLDERTLGRLASQMQMEPDEAQGVIAQAAHGFYDAAVDILGEGGIDAEAFSAFANSDPANAAKLAEASRDLVMTNNTTGLMELASSFYENADKFMPEETRKALTDAGFEFIEGSDGLKVLVDGVPVSFNVAVKQQIIKFT